MAAVPHAQRASDEVVYIIAKAPRPGHSKTRLCPPLTHEQAADLARAFLLDTVVLAQSSGADVRLMCRDVLEQQSLAEHVSADVPVDTQSTHGLGDALESAFVRGLAAGYRAVSVIGMDTPTLPPATLREAFLALRDGADVVLGPSEDGGYYLLAASAVHPHLFRDMVWSTSTVARETVDRCQTLRLRTHVLQSWQDVDDCAVLEQLRVSLEIMPATTAPHTRRALRVMGREADPAHADSSRPTPLPYREGVGG